MTLGSLTTATKVKGSEKSFCASCWGNRTELRGSEMKIWLMSDVWSENHGRISFYSPDDKYQRVRRAYFPELADRFPPHNSCEIVEVELAVKPKEGRGFCQACDREATTKE